MARFPPLAALATLAALVLSGCTSSAVDPYDPLARVAETGRTIHLKASVEDLLDHQLYPGLQANLWAFCIEPVDPNDQVSAAAIEYFPALPTDAPLLSESLRGKCSVPAPTIRVTQGDRVVVEFSHAHVHPHTIHWHGQQLPWEQDGAQGVSQEATKKGTSTTYEFIAQRAGTLWYHCHVDPQLHVMQGLYGMFIVEPQDDRFEPKDIDQEYVFILGTAKRSVVEAVPGVGAHQHGSNPCAISGTPNCQNQPIVGDPDVFLINGHSYPLTEHDESTLWKLKEGGKIRVRLLNAGTTAEAIHVHGHDFEVTHKDGVPLPTPYWADTLAILPAERYDVVLHGNNPGPWLVHTHVETHETNDHQFPGGMHTMLVYEGYEDQMHGFAAESPGGLPYMPPVPIPDDLVTSRQLPLGTSQEVAAAWSFPIENPCAVRTATLRAELQGDTLSNILTQLTLDLMDPEGDPVARLTLGRKQAQEQPQTEDEWTGEYTFPNKLPGALLKGDYNVTVAGTSVEVTVLLTATVDYYDSYEQIRLDHKLNGRPLCGTYGQGNDGLEPDPPLP
ncbi:MAG: hypothetical protein QOD77_2162 [Thermoplasmata archaeon]|jgi:plastocyanin|nr:hypothetical protein [Thermoplasmata archaeon]